MRKTIYLDNNATTPVDRSVRAAMEPYLFEHFGNPSSVHSFGRRARAAVVDARQRIARAIDASQEEILFTASGTEADNLAILGIARAISDRGRHIITSRIEHPAVLHAVGLLSKEGFEVTVLPVQPDASIDPEDLASAIRDDTILISLSLANNEVGTILPLDRFLKIASERGVAFHTDAVQAIGKIPLSVETLHVDALSLSAHKIHGPKGIGALFLREGTAFEPVLVGGGQESGRRPGTENVAAIVGFAQAVENAVKRAETGSNRLTELSRRFLGELENSIEGVHLNGSLDCRLPNTLNLSFDGVDSEVLVINLDLLGIAVSAGSACSSGATQVSHVLEAMDIPRERRLSAIRVSLSPETTWEDLVTTAECMRECVSRIRKFRTSGPDS